ncbi:glycosyltransferase family 2 protein [Leeuwenhoekiella sp. W20_SRS_FM14]|uniref:glycosyltransferase family 2 protein n=1 Tax=Leeuwenhoekiella sp. W20_SRS_FM14 TaxID=3240270 RepID=UPI003F983CC5
MPLLAIVIPYYKIDFFEECLESLVNQTNKWFKVYIGNDNSPSDPTSMITKYQNKLNITYKFFPSNWGKNSLPEHWNRTINLINDEKWIMVLCDDDMLGPKVVEEFYRKLREVEIAEINLIRFATQEINGTGEIISNIQKHPKLQCYSDLFYSRFIRGGRSSLSEHIFRKKAYDKYKFKNFPLAWHADDYAWLEFSDFGFVYSINTALVYFRLSEFNISRPNYLLDEKREYALVFFKKVLMNHIHKFKPEHQYPIIRYAEMLNYPNVKRPIKLWSDFFLLTLRYAGIWEALKFSRRVYLNSKVND